MLTLHTTISPADDESAGVEIEVTAPSFAEARDQIHERTPTGWVNHGLITGGR